MGKIECISYVGCIFCAIPKEKADKQPCCDDTRDHRWTEIKEVKNWGKISREAE